MSILGSEQNINRQETQLLSVVPKQGNCTDYVQSIKSWHSHNYKLSTKVSSLT
jgi:hypothetical protein